MNDLKAAAERLRSQISEYRDNHYLNSDQNADNRARHESLMGSIRLAAQALEALAWQAENKAGVGPGWTETGWLCEVRDQEYYADTPLGAILAAMKEEA